MGVQTIVADLRAFVNGRTGYEATAVLYGRRALTRQDNQGGAPRANRVVICPPLARLGVFGNFAREPGQPVGGGIDASGAGRPLNTITLPYEVHCWARVSATDEQANDDAAILLANLVIVGLRRGREAGFGSGSFARYGFTSTPVEEKFGSEVVFDFVVPLRVEDITVPALVPVAFDTTVSVVAPDGTSLEDEEFVTPPA